MFRDRPSLSPPGREFLTTTPPRPGLLLALLKPGDRLFCIEAVPVRKDDDIKNIWSFIHSWKDHLPNDFQDIWLFLKY